MNESDGLQKLQEVLSATKKNLSRRLRGWSSLYGPWHHRWYRRDNHRSGSGKGEMEVFYPRHAQRDL